MAILSAIGDTLSSLLTCVQMFIQALFFEQGGSSAKAAGSFATDGVLNALLPLVAIGIAISVVFLAVKVVKKISWGY